MMFSYSDRVRDAELARQREVLKGSGRVVRTREVVQVACDHDLRVRLLALDRLHDRRAVRRLLVTLADARVRAAREVVRPDPDIQRRARCRGRADPEVAELHSTFTVRQLGPFPVALQHTAPGEYIAQAVQLPYSGTWQLRVTVRTSDIDETTVATPIDIR